MSGFFKKNGSIISTFFLIAITFWLIFLILTPQLYMLDLSFRPNLPPLLRGGPDDVYTLTHYKHFVFGSETSKDAYNYVDIGVFVDTIGTAILVTIINLCFCYPIAFYPIPLVQPPSAVTEVPIMLAARSEARNTISPAMSSGSPSLPKGIWLV